MNRPFSILIVEDELLIAEMLADLLQDLHYTVVGKFGNYDDALEFLNTQPKPDLCLLDINLESDKTGFDLAQIIHETFKIPFVFLTSYADNKTISEAILLKPEAYLLKPFKSTDLFTTIEIIRNRFNSNKDNNTVYLLKDGSKTTKIKIQDIIWLKSENIYVEIQTTQTKFLLRKSLEGLLQELNEPNMVRTHRSYAVNLAHFNSLSGDQLQIGKFFIPISRLHKDNLLEKFSAFNS